MNGNDAARNHYLGLVFHVMRRLHLFPGAVSDGASVAE